MNLHLGVEIGGDNPLGMYGLTWLIYLYDIIKHKWSLNLITCIVLNKVLSYIYSWIYASIWWRYNLLEIVCYNEFHLPAFYLRQLIEYKRTIIIQFHTIHSFTNGFEIRRTRDNIPCEILWRSLKFIICFYSMLEIVHWLETRFSIVYKWVQILLYK